MLLVTTALEDSWGNDEEILFMGEWCKLYAQKNVWGNRRTETLSDPWSDRERRYAAYQYTEGLYQETINSLAGYLNGIHGVDYPVRYWKILCGPWLRLFINALYHKWECIEDVIRRDESIRTFAMNIKHDQMVPVDMSGFETIMVSDQWNHYLSLEVIKERGLFCETVSIDDAAPAAFTLAVFNKPSARRRLLVSLFERGIRLINRPTSVFISEPYLSRVGTLLLGARLRSVPRLSSYPDWNQIYIYDSLLRSQNVARGKSCVGFEQLLNRIVLSHIPYNYLEGFSHLQRVVDDVKWQACPTAILTATDHFSDDVFKCYAANKILTGSKLKIICHGGGGKVKYSDYQSLELDICDNYFTWGWAEYWVSKCTKGFFVKRAIKKRVKNSGQHTLLHITLSQFRYTKFISSMPSYEQFISRYLEDQIQFLNRLPMEIKNETVTKLHYDFENSIQDRINDKCSNVHYAPMGTDYYKLLSNAKLVVATYNCTTPVESIAMNIPTIIFWHSEHWELTPSAIPLFNKLHACGIFHHSPESAALKVRQVWDDVDGWWQSQDVVSACIDFRMWFCRESREPTKELVDFCNL
jgi:putative transferase (TIGR04331 family)